MRKIVSILIFILIFSFTSGLAWSQDAAREALFGEPVGSDPDSAREYLFGDNSNPSQIEEPAVTSSPRKTKPHLKYKGIQLRSSGLNVFEGLVNNGIVPFDKMNTVVKQNDRCGYIYQFVDTIASYKMTTQMLVRWGDIYHKDENKSHLVYVMNLYKNSDQSPEELQVVYDSLLQYFEEMYGEDYIENQNEVIWNCFRNSEDELSLKLVPEERYVIIKYLAKDELDKYNEMTKELKSAKK